MGDFGPEVLVNHLSRSIRVLDDIVKQPGCDANRIQLEVREDVGHFKRVDQIRLSGLADLAAVLPGREEVCPPEQVLVGARMVAAHFYDYGLESDHFPPKRYKKQKAARPK